MIHELWARVALTIGLGIVLALCHQPAWVAVGGMAIMCVIWTTTERLLL